MAISHGEILNLLSRQAQYDSGPGGGALIGGARRAIQRSMMRRASGGCGDCGGALIGGSSLGGSPLGGCHSCGCCGCPEMGHHEVQEEEPRLSPEQLAYLKADQDYVDGIGPYPDDVYPEFSGYGLGGARTQRPGAQARAIGVKAYAASNGLTYKAALSALKGLDVALDGTTSVKVIKPKAPPKAKKSEAEKAAIAADKAAKKSSNLSRRKLITDLKEAGFKAPGCPPYSTGKDVPLDQILSQLRRAQALSDPRVKDYINSILAPQQSEAPTAAEVKAAIAELPPAEAAEVKAELAVLPPAEAAAFKEALVDAVAAAPIGTGRRRLMGSSLGGRRIGRPCGSALIGGIRRRAYARY